MSRVKQKMQNFQLGIVGTILLIILAAAIVCYFAVPQFQGYVNTTIVPVIYSIGALIVGTLNSALSVLAPTTAYLWRVALVFIAVGLVLSIPFYKLFVYLRRRAVGSAMAEVGITAAPYALIKTFITHIRRCAGIARMLRTGAAAAGVISVTVEPVITGISVWCVHTARSWITAVIRTDVIVIAVNGGTPGTG